MTYAALCSKVADYLNRTDLTNQCKDFVNMAMHRTEREHNWKCMAYNATGNFTSSIDYISEPTRYKATKSLLITVNSTRQVGLRRTDWTYLKEFDSYGSNSKSEPTHYAFDNANSKIMVRPYPVGTYAYDLDYWAYTIDLSADSDTNFWTDTAWEVLLYGALLESEPFLVNDTRIKTWTDFYIDSVTRLKKAERREESLDTMTASPSI
jgi:hypothetical protein